MLCNRWNHWFHLFPLLRLRHRPFHRAQRIEHAIEPLAHRMQRQCVTFPVTMACVTVTQRMPLRQQQLKLRSWVGRLRYVLGIIQPRPLWPSPGSGGSRRCLAPAAGGVVILLNVGHPLMHPFNSLNIPAALCCRWFL